MKQETIKIRYFPGAAQPLDYIDGKSDWIDLRAAERVELKAGQFRLIRLGVAMALPAGYEAHVVPRSSTFKTWGILQTNSMGVIDGSYRADPADPRMPVPPTPDTRPAPAARPRHPRIVENQPKIVFEPVEHLEGPDRGGFGSTGTK